MKKFNHLSDRSLLALYLALCAARKGATEVRLSNAVLKQWFFGSAKGRRLSEPRIKNFAETLKPIFRRPTVKRTQYGPYLVLYLNEKHDQSSQAKPEYLSIPHRDTVNKALGVQEITS